MDVVIKISSDYTAANTTAQFLNPSDLSCVHELVNSGVLSFTVPLSDPQIGSIYECQKVALYAIEEGEDRILWSGYIDEIENNFAYAIVKCGDEKDFLRNKMISNPVNWLSVDVETAFAAMVAEINGRKAAHEPSFTLETNIGGTMVDKEFSAGTSCFDILKQCAEALNAEVNVVFNKIIFKTTIGVDRSIPGENYFQFIWNKDSPNENNIQKIKNTRSTKQITTMATGKSSVDAQTYTGDTSVFGSIERTIPMDNGNLSIQTQEYVIKHQVSQNQRDFEVTVSESETRQIEVGDVVSVKIVHGSVLVDTDEPLKVIQKEIKFENKFPTVSIKLATSSKEISSPENYLSDLNRRVKRFELY